MNRIWTLLSISLICLGVKAAQLSPDISIHQLSVEGIIKQEQLTVVLRLEAESATAEGRIPLLGSNAVLASSPRGDGWSITLDPQTAQPVLVIDQAHKKIAIEASFYIQTETEKDRSAWRQAKLTIPSAGKRTIQVLLDQPDMALDVPEAFATHMSDTKEGRKLSAHLNATSDVTIRWQPKLASVEPDLLMAVETHTMGTVRAEGIELISRYHYKIHQGKLRQVELVIPTGVQLRSQTGCSEWRLEEGKLNTPRTLTGYLSEPAASTHTIKVTTFIPLERLPAEIAITIPQPKNVTRAEGMIALGTQQAIQINPHRTTGLNQTNKEAFPALPELKADTPKLFTYAFSAPPFNSK